MASFGAFDAVDSVSNVIGELELNVVRESFHIPEDIDIILPAQGQSIRHPPPGYYGMYTRYLYDGVTLPLPYWLTRYLCYLGVPLCQLDPQALRLILSLHYLMITAGQAVHTSVAQIAFCFRAVNGSVPLGGWVTLIRRRGLPKTVMPSRTLFRWKDRFIFVGENSLGRDLRGREMVMPSDWSSIALPNVAPRLPDDFEGMDGMFLQMLLQQHHLQARLSDLLAHFHPYRRYCTAAGWHNQIARIVNQQAPNTMPTVDELLMNR